MAIRLDGDPPAPTDVNSKTISCPTPIHGAIKAKFVLTKIGGLPADDLRFTVPPELLHPSGLDNTVRNTVSTIQKKTAKKKYQGKKGARSASTRDRMQGWQAHHPGDVHRRAGRREEGHEGQELLVAS